MPESRVRRRRRPAANALAAIAGAQWAIQRDVLDTITAVARRANLTPEAVEAMRGEPLQNTRRVTVRDGIASIPVRGPMFRYANIFTRVSGATSYEDVALDFRTALDDPAVRAIVLVVDSPGGEVNGCAELANQIYEAREQKPIVAYVGGYGTSGAYWLAAACSEIVAANTAIVGSIGVIWGMEIVRRNDETVEEYMLVSSQSPRKHVDVRTEEGRAELQVMVDALGDVFVHTVAKYRGVTPEVVLRDFGQGGMFVGEAAIAPGLIDRLGSYEDLLTELSSAGSTATAPSIGGRASTATPHEETMAKTRLAKQVAARRSAPQGSAAAAESDEPTKPKEPEEGAAAAEDGATKACPECGAEVADDATECPECGHTFDDGEPQNDEPSALEKLRRAAAQAENERIAKIRALDGPADLIQACIDDLDCTPEAAAYRILTAKRSRAAAPSNRLAALRSDDQGRHPTAGASRPTATDTLSPREAGRAAARRYHETTKRAI